MATVATQRGHAALGPEPWRRLRGRPLALAAVVLVAVDAVVTLAGATCPRSTPWSSCSPRAGLRPAPAGAAARPLAGGARRAADARHRAFHGRAGNRLAARPAHRRHLGARARGRARPRRSTGAARARPARPAAVRARGPGPRRGAGRRGGAGRARGLRLPRARQRLGQVRALRGRDPAPGLAAHRQPVLDARRPLPRGPGRARPLRRLPGHGRRLGGGRRARHLDPHGHDHRDRLCLRAHVLGRGGGRDRRGPVRGRPDRAGHPGLARRPHRRGDRAHDPGPALRHDAARRRPELDRGHRPRARRHRAGRRAPPDLRRRRPGLRCGRGHRAGRLPARPAPAAHRPWPHGGSGSWCSVAAWPPT